MFGPGPILPCVEQPPEESRNGVAEILVYWAATHQNPI